jgi:hypothetical protein
MIAQIGELFALSSIRELAMIVGLTMPVLKTLAATSVVLWLVVFLSCEVIEALGKRVRRR